VRLQKQGLGTTANKYLTAATAGRTGGVHTNR